MPLTRCGGGHQAQREKNYGENLGQRHCGGPDGDRKASVKLRIGESGSFDTLRTEGPPLPRPIAAPRAGAVLVLDPTRPGRFKFRDYARRRIPLSVKNMKCIK